MRLLAAGDDALVDLEEFQKALSRMGFEANKPEGLKLFQHFDSDKSGKINYEEFLLALRCACLHHPHLPVRHANSARPASNTPLGASDRRPQPSEQRPRGERRVSPYSQTGASTSTTHKRTHHHTPAGGVHSHDTSGRLGVLTFAGRADAAAGR